MGIKYLWDTNTAIYFLQQQFPKHAEKIIDKSLKEGQPCISAITEIELLCWKAASQKDLEAINLFISNVLVIEIEQDIKIKTVDIRKKYKIKLPDAIIAATALVYDLTLITRNITDFKNITALKTLDPYNQ